MGFEPGMAAFLGEFYEGQVEHLQDLFYSLETSSQHPYCPASEDCSLCSGPFAEHLAAGPLFTRHLGRAEATCSVCLEELSRRYMFTHLGRSHEICLPCLRSFVGERVDAGRCELACLECRRGLDKAALEGVVPERMLRKYERNLKRKALLSEPMLRGCPGVDCQSTIRIDPSARQASVTCPSCGTRVCVACSRVHHPALTCDEVFEKELKELNALQANVQKCPMCRMAVEKVSGCNHMSCSFCRHEFCWLCRGTYTSYHFMPLNPLGCPGLANSRMQDWGCLKRCLYRLLILLGMLLAVVPVLLLLMVVGGPVLVFKNARPRACLFSVCCVLLGLLLNPFLWVAAVLASPVALVAFIFKYC